MSGKTTDQILLDAIQGLRDDIARIDDDLSKDRNANEQLAMAVNSNTEQVNHFGNRLEIIEKKIQGKIADIIAPMMESADNLADTIDKKKMTAEQMVNLKVVKPWFKFWK